MSTTILRDFAFRLGFQVDDKDIGKLERGLARARAGWDGLTSAARRTAAELGAVALIAGAGIAKITADTAAYGDGIAKLARQLGVGVQELQELQFAAERSGANVNALRIGIKTAARQAADFGISASDLMEQVADQVAGASSSTERLVIAQKMLGEEGTALIPMLLGGAAGLREMRKEARDLGIVIDQDATDAAETFADRMQDLRSLLAGMRNQIGNAIIPVVNDLSSGIIRWYTSNKLLIRQRLDHVAEVIADAIRRAGQVIEDVDRLVRENLGGWGSVFKGASVGATGLYAALLAFRFGGPLVQIGIGLATAASAVTGLTVGAAGLTIGLTALAALIGALLTATGIAGLVLLFDDLNTLLEGGDALIGRWIDSFRDGSAEGEAFADMLESIALFFGDYNALIGDAIGLAYDFFVVGFGGAAQAVSDLTGQLGELVGMLLQLVGIETPDIFNAIGAVFERGRAGTERNRERVARGRGFLQGLPGGNPQASADAAAQRQAQERARAAALRATQSDAARAMNVASTTNQSANVAVNVDARGRDAPGQTGAEVGFAVDRAVRGALAGVSP